MRDDDDRIFRDTFLEERSEERAHALLVTVTILLIVAGTIAGAVPAWKAARVKPIEALRAE